MFQTKKDIDKHVRSSLSRLRDNEKNLRGYTIARMYFKIGEYSTALHWVSLYLTANDNCAAAHKFKGQCFDKLKKPDQQLVAYQRSLELDKKQSDLLIEVCKLLQTDEITGVTASKARYWYELAESRNIQDDAVLNLKLKYLEDENNGNFTSRNVQDIILKEIVLRPFDIGLRIRLLRHFLDQNKIDEAFKYAFDIEMKQNGQFRNSIDWYLATSQVLDEYKALKMTTLNRDWHYWLLLICTLERQAYLCLIQSPNDSSAITQNLTDTINYLFQFDQNLNKFAGHNIALETDRELISEFLCHYRGQFCLHAATLLFKRELVATPRNNWFETTKSALPLLLLAYNCNRIVKSQIWLKNATEPTKQLINLWSIESVFRCCQAGRTLLSCIETQSTSDNTALANLRKICTDKYSVWSNCDDVLNEIRRSTTDSDWRKKLYRKLFSNTDQITLVSSSYFVKCKAFETPGYTWPDIVDLNSDEETSQAIEPSALSHLVYLAFGNDANAIRSDVKCRVFGDLNFSISNLVNCGVETLNQLDIDTFLYATTIQAKRSLDIEKSYLTGNANSERFVSNKPKILPYANMANRLCTDEQTNWWLAAYKVYNNISGDELAELRATLQYGIEAVRGVGSPKIDLIILLKLGQLFYKRSQESNKTVERGFLEARTEALFKYSLYMLRMQNSSRTSIEPFRRLFKYAVSNSQFEIDTEINTLSEEAITFLAGRYFKNNEYEECIEDLAGIKLPFATYFQAESYRKMTELTNTPKKNKRAYLEKAKDYLSQTLDLLDAPNVDKNHPLKSIVDADIKRLQHESRKLETNQSMTDSFVSANGRSDLDDSIARYQRDTTSITPVAVAHNGTIERLIREMMESLTLLKDDVADVRNKVQNIEEQLSKQQDAKSVDPLDEYYFTEEDLQQTANSFLNNTSMYTNTSRMNTSNAFSGQQPRTPQYGVQPSAALNSPYNMSPLYNSALYQQMGLNSINPYQAALANAAAIAPNRNQIMPPLQMQTNFVTGQVQPSYGADALSYNLQQQYSQSQQLVNDPRTAGLMNLLQHQSNQPQLLQATQLPQSQLQPQQQVTQSTPSTFGLSNINQAVVSTTPITSAIPSFANSVDHNIIPSNPNATQKQWNPIFNNAPVEKAPPVNVVITSSDPLPTHNTVSISNQQALSVTIPPQHIKNNNIGSGTQPLSASKANPVITAALQDKKTPQTQSKPLIGKSTVAEKDVKTTTASSTTPSVVEQKSIFGNISSPFSSTPFSSPTTTFGTPKTQENPKADTSKTDSAKPNPFASFSFGQAPVDASSNETKPLFSFSNIGQSLQTSASGSASQTEKRIENVANVSGSSVAKEGEDDYVPTAHFEPVISLPDLVEVKTGEENENILFEHRAKLLRFVRETKEWKERGIGNMKVLANKSDPNQVRLLMRREQVLKLCCNQMLTKDTKFNKLSNMGTAMSWYGQDYSENELQIELLAIRFKTAEVCTQFHEAILSAQNNMTATSAEQQQASSEGASSSTSIAAVTSSKPSDKKPTSAKNPEGKGFGDKFKPKVGSWLCDECYLTNKESEKRCAACNSPKDKNDAAADIDKSKSVAFTTNSTFTFGSQPAAAASTVKPITKTADSTAVGFGDKFKPKAGSWSCTACYTSNTADNLYCLACEGPKDDTVPKKEAQNIFASTAGTQSKFSFGTLSSWTGAAPTTAGNGPTTSTIPFGDKNVSGGFQFGSKPTTESSKPIDIVAPKIESKEFGFVFKPKSPGKPKSPHRPHTNSTSADGVEDVSDDENVEEEENNTYFTPVIALPDKIDVKTGEEEETVLYTHRAKLYRFKDSEWKERGLGDVKILQHKQTGRMRVVMRREQILKICLNHALTHDIEYKPKDSKSWHFIVNDFSEGEVELEQFCLRFKNEEIAKDFKSAIDNALAGVTSKQNGGGHIEKVEPRESLQSKLTAEENKKIVDLQLPANFFDYKDTNKCSGCRGCNSDAFIFPEVKTINLGIVDDNPLPLSLPAKIQSNNLSKEPQIQATQTNAFSFNSFGAQPSFGNVFGSKPDVTVTVSNTAPATSSFFFGNNAANSNTSTIFGNAAPVSAASSEPTKPSTFSFSSPGNNIFGGSATSNQNGAAKATSTFSFNSFGGTNASTTSTTSTTTTASLFSNSKFSTNQTDDTSKPLAGLMFKAAPTATSIFGGFSGATAVSTGENQTKDTPNFSFAIPSTNTATNTVNTDSPIVPGLIQITSTPILEAENAISTTQSPLESSSIFKNDSALSFSAIAQKSIAETGDQKDLSKNISNEFSFASLAANQTKDGFAALAQSTFSNNTSFNNSVNTTGGFFGLSNRDDFSNFGAKTQGSLNGSAGKPTDNVTENAVDDPNYDPHYEPIIALPDEIKLSTGEENEQKLFGDRAKLFRYDTTNKEWKERGVGELKILHHPINNSYRLLLRREQIHKLVLNLALSTDFQMNPMKQSDKAFCWVATNFAEDTEKGALESLSVRFKNGQIAQKFNDIIQKCLEQLRTRGELEPEDD